MKTRIGMLAISGFLVLAFGCSRKTTGVSSAVSADTAATLDGVYAAVLGAPGPNQPLPQPSSGDNRPYFPLASGFYWNYVNTRTQSPLKVSIGGSPDHFGPSKQYMAVGPFDVEFEKRDPANYWCPGVPWNLRWYLGYDPNGVLISTATSIYDYNTGLTLGDELSLYSLTPNMPPYYLVPSDPKVTSVSNLHQYVGRSGETPDPLSPSDPKNSSTINAWNVTWAPDVVSVPAYSGPVLRAHYDERDPADPNGGQIEDWFYARGVGVVKIIAYRDSGVNFDPPMEIDLESYSLVPQSLLPRVISFRDRLASFTGSYGTSTTPGDRNYGLTYDQWNAASASIGTVGPTDAQACVSAAMASTPISIDAYLALVTAAGNCSSGTPPPAPSAPKCQLLVNGATSATYKVGANAETYSIICNQPNLTFDWHGTKDGVVDVTSPHPVTYFPAGTVYSAVGPNGVSFTYPAFSAEQEAYRPGYVRWVGVRDAQGNPILDSKGNPIISNSVFITVLP